MNRRSEFSGAWCPSVTPFTSEGKIDFAALQSHLNRLTEARTSVILVMGSIGEFLSMTLSERLLLIEEARRMSPTPMVANISAGSVEDMLVMARKAYQVGYQGVMFLPHFYFSQTRNQILSYYREISKQLDGKWFAYNFPQRTGCDVDASIIGELAAEIPSFVGVKDTVDCLSHTRAMVQATQEVRPDFAVLSGYDEYFIPNMMSGGAGVISGLNNIAPELFVAALDAYQANDFGKLNHIQMEIGRLSSIYTTGDDFVTTIKTVVSRKFGYMLPGSRNYGGALTEKDCQRIDTVFGIGNK